MRALPLLLASTLAACAGTPPAAPTSSPGAAASAPARPALARVCVQGKGFVTCDARERFVPWGFNYDHDRHTRLLEDYWEAEWPTVEQDFAEMRELGANVVRVQLQIGRFMRGPDAPDEGSLARLGRLLDLAERTGLRLDLTGLAAYRPADTPAWYDDLGEAERWRVQARFWRAVAHVGARSPAVFAYDLMNEPVVPGEPRPPRGWVHEAELDGLHYIQHIVLDRAGRRPGDIAHAWVAELAGALRAEDPRALVTVGMLPDYRGFAQADVSDLLDYGSVHLYPRSDHEAESLDVLRRDDTAEPLVIEEMAPMRCSVAELQHFIVASRPLAAGWLGFYWGKTPAELAASGTLADGVLLAVLRMLAATAPR